MEIKSFSYQKFQILSKLSKFNSLNLSQANVIEFAGVNCSTLFDNEL